MKMLLSVSLSQQKFAMIIIVHCFQDVFEKIAPMKYLGNEEELAALHRSSAPEMPDEEKIHHFDDKMD